MSFVSRTGSKGCDGSYPLQVQVDAYPKIKAEFTLGLTYDYSKTDEELPKLNETPKSVTQKGASSAGSKTVILDRWKITVDLKGNVDIISMCCESKIGSKINQITLDGVQLIENDDKKAPTTGQLMDRSASGPTGTIKLRYPKVALAIAYENSEAKNKAILGSIWSVSLKADPLIGVEAKVDILSALIKIGANALLPGSAQAGKAFASYIWPIVKQFMSPDDPQTTAGDIEKRKYYLEAGISLVMTVGANLGCDAKWSKNTVTGGESSSSTSGSANATLDIFLEGKVYAKGKAWKVHFEAGMMVAMGSAKEMGAAKLDFKLSLVDDGGEVKVKGGVEWNGLAILSASYMTFGVKDDDNGEADGNIFTNEEDDENSGNAKALDYGQWVLIEPGKYPKDENVPLSEYTQL